MLARIFILLIATFFAELMLLLQLSESIGWGQTFFLVLISGLFGAALIRFQGVLTLLKARSELGAGRSPTKAISDGLLLVFAGALFIFPGVLTDIAGILLLIPPVRRHIAQQLQIRLTQKATSQVERGFRGFQVYEFRQTTSQTDPQSHDHVQPPRYDSQGNEIIDVEFTRKTEHLPDNRDESSS